MGKTLFHIATAAKRPGLLRAYREARAHEAWTLSEMEAYQSERLRELMAYCAAHVPYYQSLFAEHGVDWRSITDAPSLAALPTLTKAQIREAGDRIHPTTPVPFTNGATGGSTGQPLKYRMSTADSDWGMALLFRGWGYGGYRLGDRVAIVAGGSISSRSASLGARAKDLVLNMDHYSTYGMSAEAAEEYVRRIARSGARFLRGYATALHRIALTVERTGVEMPRLEAAFSTAEMLTPAHRRKIESVLGVAVYDTYGLNDGGVSAYECGQGPGMHVDYERGLLEVVDDEGQPIREGVGRVLATSLRNTALPFVRYETGDLAEISYEVCPCGRPGPLLTSIMGRQTDEIEINGRTIGSPVLTVLMGKTHAEEYRIRQVSSSKLVFEIVPGQMFGAKDVHLIRESIETHLGNVNIDIDLKEEIYTGDGSKHKIILIDF